MKIVTLRRNNDDGIQTLGTLTFPVDIAQFNCKTLEKPWVLNANNVSCIPKGTYIVKWTFSPKFLKYTYEVQGVLNRTGIRIHGGNFFYDIKGCILLGDSYGDINKDGHVDILNSKITLKKFEEALGRQTFTLQII